MHFFIAPASSLLGIANAFIWTYSIDPEDRDPNIPVYRVSLSGTPQYTPAVGSYREYALHVFESRIAGKPKYLSYVAGLARSNLGTDEEGRRITQIPNWDGPMTRGLRHMTSREQLRRLWPPYKNGVSGDIYENGGVDYGGVLGVNYTKDLDEYPFASTAEAWLIGPHYKPIDKDENQLGGNDLGVFYTRQFGAFPVLGTSSRFRVRLVL
jgi:hypothetical protein